jgi:L-fucose isomerase-like protein
MSTADCDGSLAAYVGEGAFTDDKLDTFGGYGVIEIPDFQGLLNFICENGFEHHVAANLSQVGAATAEALDKYLDWYVYHHEG